MTIMSVSAFAHFSTSSNFVLASGICAAEKILLGSSPTNIAAVWCSAYTTLADKPVCITHRKALAWDDGDTLAESKNRETFSFEHEPNWLLHGITLVDDNGNMLDRAATEAAVEENFGIMCKHDLTNVDVDALVAELGNNHG